jgi:CRP/FNR family transcriptional regulator, cyclic AMP receptor protein
MPYEINLPRIARLLGVIDIVSVGPGKFLFSEGDEADALYIVKSGVVQVIAEDGAVYDTVGDNGIVGELAIVDEGTRSASILAHTPAELVKVDIPGFLELVASEPEFALAVMRVMARRLRLMNSRRGARACTHA